MKTRRDQRDQDHALKELSWLLQPGDGTGTAACRFRQGLGAPYNINKVLAMNATTFSFTASTAGMFSYECTYHQPTMTGTLVVLGN